MTVAEECQVRRAAQRLRIDPSAVSRRIYALEHDLGVELFARSSDGLHLTPAGRLLRDGLQAALSQVDVTIDQVCGIDSSQAGKLRIGVVEGMIRVSAFPDMLADFRTRYPEANVELLPMSSHEQIAALRRYEVDVALAREGTDLMPDLAHWQIASHPLLLALPLDHHLAGQPNVTIADLAGEPLLWPRADVAPKIAKALDNAFSRARVTPRIVMHAGTTEGVLSMVGAGQAIGFVDEVFCDGRGDVVLRQVADFTFPVIMQLAWRAAERSVLVHGFLAVAKSVSKAA